jgi:hypothetical protein
LTAAAKERYEYCLDLTKELYPRLSVADPDKDEGRMVAITLVATLAFNYSQGMTLKSIFLYFETMFFKKKHITAALNALKEHRVLRECGGLWVLVDLPNTGMIEHQMEAA